MWYTMSQAGFSTVSGGARGRASQADTCRPRMDLAPLRPRQDRPAA
nr:MAG TPA: hypothetical protein [Caudoviricetes sp.]